jgi:phytoene dehydrogenase-like protein
VEELMVIVIGAGHNGLITAFYLAQAGFSTLVLERRDVVGGTAVTEEIHPGFRCPAIFHSAGPLLPKIAHDMQLEKHGLQMIRPDLRVLALPVSGGPAFRIYDDPQRTAAELARVSTHDGKNYPEFYASFRELGRAIAPLLSMTPPDIDHLTISDYLNAGQLGLKFRGLGKKDAYRLLRWGPMAVADLAAEWFETELVRAAIEARGIFGMFGGPWSAGTSVGLLMQAAIDGQATSPASFVRGGTGALTEALSKSASAAGVQVRTNANVVAIRVKENKATGVVLESGEEITAIAVVSGADPKRTFLNLVNASDLEPGFLAKIRAYRAMGTAGKMNLALSRLPSFIGIQNGSNDLSGRIHIGPDTDYLERAFDAVKYGRLSPRPYLDIAIPSITDSTLAPKGAHVMSIHVQYMPYDTRRDELADAVIKTLSEYAPDIRETMVHHQVLTPRDLEQTYGLTGGHIFHGEHGLDQLFAFRPLLGWARYRTPINSLYLCGAGTHPGGGLTGAPGSNAAREIIRELKS